MCRDTHAFAAHGYTHTMWHPIKCHTCRSVLTCSFPAVLQSPFFIFHELNISPSTTALRCLLTLGPIPRRLSALSNVSDVISFEQAVL